MLIGFFEGLDSERGIAWRVADWSGLREFLGYGIDESTRGSRYRFPDTAIAGHRHP